MPEFRITSEFPTHLNSRMYSETGSRKITAGIVLLVIRDTKSNSPIEDRPIPSVLDRLTYPIASVYNNLSNMQDINNDIRIEKAKDWFKGELDVVEIAYDSHYNATDESDVKRASLSWHLTSLEKKNIIENINIESNKAELKRLKELLKSSSTP